MSPLTWSIAVGLEAVLLHSRTILLVMIPLVILTAIILPYASRRYLLNLTLALLVLQTATLFHPSFARGYVLILESRIIFVGLILIYLCILLLPRALRQPDRRLLSTTMLLAFLLFYAAGAMILSHGVRPGGLGQLPGSHLSVHTGGAH